MKSITCTEMPRCVGHPCCCMCHAWWMPGTCLPPCRVFVRSDAELKEIMYELSEQEETHERYRRTHAVIPPMLIEESEKRVRYLNSNGLISDPMALHRDSRFIGLWSEEEKAIFRDKSVLISILMCVCDVALLWFRYTFYPKKFGLISSFLPNKVSYSSSLPEPSPTHPPLSFLTYSPSSLLPHLPTLLSPSSPTTLLSPSSPTHPPSSPNHPPLSFLSRVLLTVCSITTSPRRGRSSSTWSARPTSSARSLS